MPKSVPQSDANSLVQVKLRWILEGCRPTRVFLFGSAARNELTEHSDIDFAVLFHSEAELRDARKSIFARPRPDDWPQDILLFTEAEYERKKAIGGVCAIIEEDGKLLYTKEHA
jgi:predicted nucleotidyltransferase